MMKKNKLDGLYWSHRYMSGDIPWDIGAVSTPIKEYIDSLRDKNLRILVPGAGNAYEAEYLWSLGFKNTYILDVSEKPLKEFTTRNQDFPNTQVLNENFFNHNKKYDLIIEQTFFCALRPELRMQYVEKMTQLLKPKGKLAGLFFDFRLSNEGPPFGGDTELYLKLFKECFRIIRLERAHNSIDSRRNKELFFIFEKTTC